MRPFTMTTAVLLALLASPWPALAQDDTEDTPEADTPGAVEAERDARDAIEAAEDADALEPEPEVPSPPRRTVGRLWLRFTGGFGGDYVVQPRSIAVDGNQSTVDPFSEALEPSLGGHVQFEVPVFDSSHVGLSLGFWTGVVTWITDTSDRLDLGRATWIDLDLTVRLEVPVLNGLLAPYLLVPAGLTVNRFSDTSREASDVAWGHGPGFNIGAMLGLALDLDGHGVFVEGGWMHRQFFHESAGTTFGTPVTFELDGSTHQAHLGAGLFFDL